MIVKYFSNNAHGQNYEKVITSVNPCFFISYKNPSLLSDKWKEVLPVGGSILNSFNIFGQRVNTYEFSREPQTPNATRPPFFNTLNDSFIIFSWFSVN